MATNGDNEERGQNLEIGKPIVPKLIDRREHIRERVTIHLIWAITFIAIVSIVVIAVAPDRSEGIKDVLPIILTGFFGAFGTAIAFYFSHKK